MAELRRHYRQCAHTPAASFAQQLDRRRHSSSLRVHNAGIALAVPRCWLCRILVDGGPRGSGALETATVDTRRPGLPSQRMG